MSIIDTDGIEHSKGKVLLPSNDSGGGGLNLCGVVRQSGRSDRGEGILTPLGAHHTIDGLGLDENEPGWAVWRYSRWAGADGFQAMDFSTRYRCHLI